MMNKEFKILLRKCYLIKEIKDIVRYYLNEDFELNNKKFKLIYTNSKNIKDFELKEFLDGLYNNCIIQRINNYVVFNKEKLKLEFKLFKNENNITLAIVNYYFINTEFEKVIIDGTLYIFEDIILNVVKEYLEN